MLVKDVIYVDYINYKKPCMVIGFPYCSFKCDKECGVPVCQNSALTNQPDIYINTDDLIKRYLSSSAEAVVCQGLEPLDSFKDLWFFISKLRREYHCYDDVVIYTGYTEEELENPPSGLSKLFKLRQFPNIIVKFGRYIPNQKPHYDEVLGVNLASDNQYAEKIS